MTEDLSPVVAAAQQVAGLLAARHRGDLEGVRALQSEMDGETMVSGSLLLAEVSLGLLSTVTEESYDTCVRRLTVDLEKALGPDR